jgi:predicted alpha/beta-hydrolase family hydrolase
MTTFLFDGPPDAGVTILLAHGAGAPMDSAWLNASAGALAAAGLRVARFEFDYMAARRGTGGRKPPPRAEMLRSEYVAAVDALDAAGLIVIGGKSMGGRVASMVADKLHAAGKIAGLLCLGYPFHPVGKPDQQRTAHLADLRTPTLIVQGTRDPFGAPDAIEAEWARAGAQPTVVAIEDGGHGFEVPRRTRDQAAAFALAADSVSRWLDTLLSDSEQ